jgi:hypothetical protein
LRGGLGRGISAVDGIELTVGHERVAAVIGVDVELEVSRVEGITGNGDKKEGQRDQKRSEELHAVEVLRGFRVVKEQVNCKISKAKWSKEGQGKRAWK